VTPIDDNIEHAAVAMPRPTGWAEVTGPDRVLWLQGMVSNDVGRLAAGQGCYAAHLNSRGRVLGLMRILAGRDRLWIAADQDVDALVGQMDRLLIMEDAAIRSRAADYRTVTVAGPEARIRLEEAVGESLEWARESYNHRVIGSARVVLGEIGFDVAVPEGEAERFISALEAVGVPLAGESEWARRSLEAGIPIYGIDVDDNTILSELGERGIDYRKGCYIGQEVVAKIKYIGHVNRHMVGLRLDGVEEHEVPGGRPPLTREGRDVGFLTRAARSPRAGGLIALGYVRHGNEALDSTFQVGEGTATATVVPLPFPAA
jgi:folate-binding protein YgfZ